MLGQVKGRQGRRFDRVLFMIQYVEITVLKYNGKALTKASTFRNRRTEKKPAG
jgi:hypothetical protein